MLGQISLDDYELKIHRLLRHSKHRAEVLDLPKGTFLYTPLDRLVKFKIFKANGKPYPCRPMPKPKLEREPKTKPKKSAWQFIKELPLFRLFEWKHRKDETIGSTEDEEEREYEAQEEEDQEDEDLLLFQEEFSEDE